MAAYGSNVKGTPGVYVMEVASGNAPIAGAGTTTAAFIGCFTYPYESGSSSSNSSSSSAAPPPPMSSSSSNLMQQRFAASNSSSSSSSGPPAPSPTIAAPGEVVLCMNYTDFSTYFMDPNYTPNDGGNGQMYLSQAVYGFFQNGGTQCFVVRIKGATHGDGTGSWNNSDFTAALANLEPITGISTVAAPGLAIGTATNSDPGPLALNELQTHCQNIMQDRFAVVDAPMNISGVNNWTPSGSNYPVSDYMGLYYPWIQVPNLNGNVGGTVNVPPSGHIAGVYAANDQARGVNKAPANIAIAGVLGFTDNVSNSRQNGYNPIGINCLRNFNGSLLVWGARTLAHQPPLQNPYPQMKYINARRFLNYLRDSLYAGLQWTVFEPNNPNLWQNVIRNVTAFLKPLWAQGALLGDTAADAFYVKCDSENNPDPQMGTLYIEVGVAIVEPAEFVQIYLNDWAGPPSA